MMTNLIARILCFMAFICVCGLALGFEPQTLVNFQVSPGTVNGNLVEGPDGNFYGTTSHAGPLGNGTIFRVTPEGALTTLVFFNGANGGYPWAGLVQGADGNFYGTTRDGGAYEYCPGCGPGIAFKVTPAGEFSLLASLDGINAVGALAEALVLGQDGNFYGVSDSGTNRDLSGQDLGNVFRLTPGGAVSSLFSFNGTNGTHPLGLMQASDGNFYGLTVLGGVGYQGHFSFGSGTIYQFTPAGAFRSLVSFTNNELPFASLVQASDGNLYGTTRNGGTYGQGTVFRLSVPMKPVMRPIAPTNGSLLVSWRAVAGQTYQLQSTLDLALPEWADLGTPLVATNGTMTILDPITPQGQRFYRVAVLP